jgi:hypothetical protein
MDEMRNTLGLVECITICKDDKKIELQAKIDTGAATCSIDKSVADSLQLVPTSKKKIRNAHGRSERDSAYITVMIAGQRIDTEATIADRSHMRYKVLLGQNLLKAGNFLVDPQIDKDKDRKERGCI